MINVMKHLLSEKLTHKFIEWMVLTWILWEICLYVTSLSLLPPKDNCEFVSHSYMPPPSPLFFRVEAGPTKQNLGVYKFVTLDVILAWKVNHFQTKNTLQCSHSMAKESCIVCNN